MMLELAENTCRTLKLPLDIFIFVKYMRLISYFVAMKKARMSENLVRFTCKNKAIVALAFVLGVLGLYATIIQVIYLHLLFFIDKEEWIYPIVLLGHDIERKIVWPITDFLMACCILYLFYSLGLRNIKNDK